MRQKPFLAKRGIVAIVAGAMLSGMVFAFAMFGGPFVARAFTGPLQAPPNGYGAIGSDASNNVSVGTSTTVSGTKLLVVGASSDNTTYAAQFWANNKTPIFLLRSDGSVSISTSTVSAGNTVIGGNLTVGGTFVASTLTGTVSAGNVSSGQFGSNTGGGNYSFAGNVGIGVSNPGTTLEVGGSNWSEIKQDGGGSPNSYFDNFYGGTFILNNAYTRNTGGNGITRDQAAALSYMYLQSGNIYFGTGPSGSASSYAGAANVATILNNGNFGVGVASPGQKLEVAGNVSSTGLCLGGVCQTSWASLGQWTSSGTAIYYNGGNVGIGTTSPSAVLEVNGAAKVDGSLSWNGANDQLNADQGGSIELGGTNTIANPISAGVPYLDFHYGTGAAQDFNVRLQNAGNNLFTISTASNGAVLAVSGGSVGIGTTAPAYKLDVQGTGNFTGVVNVGTPTSASNAATKSYVDSAVSAISSGSANYVDTYPNTSYTFDTLGTLGNSAGMDNASDGPSGTTWYHFINLSYPYSATNMWQSQIVIKPNTTGMWFRSRASATGGTGGWTAWNRLLNTGADPYPSNMNQYVRTTDSPTFAGLTVSGTASFTQPVVVGTPTAGNMAATKSYVDSAVGGGGAGVFSTLTVTGNWNISGAAQGGLNMNGYNITGVGTLGVTTIDPLYRIGGTDYETFAPTMVGVNEEVTGNGTLVKQGSDYEYAVNFPQLAHGSDLWVWYQTVDFSKDTVNAVATPYGQFAEIYYTIDGSTLTFHGNAPAQFSFRLTGKRFDWQKWPTTAAEQGRTPGFVLPVKE